LIFKVGFFNKPKQVKTEEGRPNIISGEENMIEQESRLNLDQQPVETESKIGRNELCPCGSGKKYKRCHGK